MDFSIAKLVFASYFAFFFENYFSHFLLILLIYWIEKNQYFPKVPTVLIYDGKRIRYSVLKILFLSHIMVLKYYFFYFWHFAFGFGGASIEVFLKISHNFNCHRNWAARSARAVVDQISNGRSISLDHIWSFQIVLYWTDKRIPLDRWNRKFETAECIFP